MGKKPPQSTRDKNVFASHEDEGKFFSGESQAQDLSHDGKPVKSKILGDFDIYKDHR